MEKSKVTVPQLRSLKAKKKIVMVTAYDFPQAASADRAAGNDPFSVFTRRQRSGGALAATRKRSVEPTCRATGSSACRGFKIRSRHRATG